MLKKQKGLEFFRKKNREVAKAAVAADPETADLAGKDKDNVRDAALTRGAFELARVVCVARRVWICARRPRRRRRAGVGHCDLRTGHPEEARGDVGRT